MNKNEFKNNSIIVTLIINNKTYAKCYPISDEIIKSIENNTNSIDDMFDFIKKDTTKSIIKYK